MQALGERAAAVAGRVSRAQANAADEIGLVELEVGEIVNLSTRAEGLGATGNAQVIGLLLVALVARGDVAADDQGEIVQTEIGAEDTEIDALVGEDLCSMGGK